MTARPLFKVNNSMTNAERISSLERRLVTETRRRKEAERKYEVAVLQMSRFHALLIAERILKIQRKES